MHSLATLIGPAALATKEFVIDEQGLSGRFVRIVGRKSGILDWLLGLMGIDTTTVFEVYADHIKFIQANLSGRMATLLPLTAISSTSSGFFKPVLYVMIGLPMLLAGFGMMVNFPAVGAVLLILAGVLILYYFLHKALMISVLSHSGAGAAIAFKRSVIEGIKVDAPQAQAVVDIINRLTLAAQRK